MKFTVHGIPQPAGSKRGFAIRRKSGKMGVVLSDDNPKAKPWKLEVAYEAREAMRTEPGDGLFEGPVSLSVVFWLPRPKGHYGSGKNAGAVKGSAPSYPAVKPDLLKLARAIEDAMTGVVYRDDAQIVVEYLRKAYSTNGGAYTEIEVTARC